MADGPTQPVSTPSEDEIYKMAGHFPVQVLGWRNKADVPSSKNNLGQVAAAGAAIASFGAFLSDCIYEFSVYLDSDLTDGISENVYVMVTATSATTGFDTDSYLMPTNTQNVFQVHFLADQTYIHFKTTAAGNALRVFARRLI